MCKCTYDDLLYDNLKIYQYTKGYRSSEDSLILQDCVLDYLDKDYSGNAFEFGSGCGIISILLASKRKNLSLTAIEVQDSLFGLAVKNVKQCNLTAQIKILHLDGRKVREKFAPNSFELAFSNPPFYEAKTGRLSPIEERRIAKHEILCSLPDVLDTFSYLLKPGGVGFVVYPKNRLNQFDTQFHKRSKQFKGVSYKIFNNYENEIALEPSEKSFPEIAAKNFQLFVAKIEMKN